MGGRALTPLSPNSNRGSTKILIVDDDERLLRSLARMVRGQGFEPVIATCGADALAKAASASLQGAILDFQLPDGEATGLMKSLREIRGDVPILVITGDLRFDVGVRAMSHGAVNVLGKPFESADFVAAVGAMLEAPLSPARRRSSINLRAVNPMFFGRSAAMQRVGAALERVRGSHFPLLTLGETGTGKSMIARWVHETGTRAGGPLVELNCAGLTPEFLESELFGHVRGAFTGAHSHREGFLDRANGGTLFLDEIGDIDMDVQAKLLKVLEEKRFRRMGEARERDVDIRLITATHKSLGSLIRRGRFREDLYYRISSLSVSIPPLRERVEDLVELACRLLVRICADTGADVRLGKTAERAIEAHFWPGNVRELKNVLERAVVFNGESGVIEAEHLVFDQDGSVPPPPMASSSPRFSVAALPTSASASGERATLSELEKRHIEQALEAVNGRVIEAAHVLGIPRSSLYDKIRAYSIPLSKSRTWRLKVD